MRSITAWRSARPETSGVRPTQWTQSIRVQDGFLSDWVLEYIVADLPVRHCRKDVGGGFV